MNDLELAKIQAVLFLTSSKIYFPDDYEKAYKNMVKNFTKWNDDINAI